MIIIIPRVYSITSALDSTVKSASRSGLFYPQRESIRYELEEEWTQGRSTPFGEDSVFCPSRRTADSVIRTPNMASLLPRSCVREQKSFIYCAFHFITKE
jgi:hypothetical protein